MEKEKANRIALVIAIVGSMIVVGMIEFLAYRVFGRAGVLLISALSIWVAVMMQRANR